MAKRIDTMIGSRFGRLVVLKESEYHRGHLMFQCQCDCEGEPIVRGSHLRSGKTKSCGCLRRKVGVEKYFHSRPAVRPTGRHVASSGGEALVYIADAWPVLYPVTRTVTHILEIGHKSLR